MDKDALGNLESQQAGIGLLAPQPVGHRAGGTSDSCCSLGIASRAQALRSDSLRGPGEKNCLNYTRV
ncbi:MAG: hypothetical protein NVSMB32_08060 [Actinomycetota bacterium]